MKNYSVENNSEKIGINLLIDDLPHKTSNLEWWYFHAHVEDDAGKAFAFFCSFFRIARDFNVFPFEFTHSLTWSLVDIEDQKYHSETSHDDKILSKISDDLKEKKELKPIDNAFKEIIDKGNFPAPDFLMKKSVVTSNNELKLNYDLGHLEKDEKGNYLVKIGNQIGNSNVNFCFSPLKNPVHHGENGLVKSSMNAANNMHYYFIPENAVEGNITLNNKTFRVKGSGWYDHEFSESYNPAQKVEQNTSKHWMWFAIQFDNHCQLTFYSLTDKNTTQSDRLIVWIDEKGESFTLKDDNIVIEIIDYYISKKTCAKYPVEWQVKIPAWNLDFNVKAELSDQEVMTFLYAPGFWEGRARVSGTLENEKITGNAFVEITTDKGWNNMNDLLDQAAEEVLDIIHEVVPYPHEKEKIKKLMKDYYSSYLNAVPSEILHEALIKPLLEMLDRKGKGWRSHLLRLLVGLCEGNISQYDPFVALVQLIHCSSLIIDDVQDQSPLRRGDASCHVIYGIPAAINSGTFGYFVGEILIRNMTHLSDSKMRKVYEAYFDTMRLCHAGQALDIRTFTDLLPQAFETGDTYSISESMREIHILKTGVPIKMMANIITILEDLSLEKHKAICHYGEAFGLAYQIIDDVRDLNGSFKGSKVELEDIREGKVTLPLIKAIELSQPEIRLKMKNLWSKPNKSSQDIHDIADWIISSGALTQCRKDAINLIDEKWIEIDKIFPDSHYKLMIRAMSNYFLNL